MRAMESNQEGWNGRRAVVFPLQYKMAEHGYPLQNWDADEKMSPEPTPKKEEGEW